MSLDLNEVRQQFPALNRPVIFLDNPGGTQICRPSLERIQRYLVEMNANHGGLFATSRASDAALAAAREAMADFLNAARPEEIVFGPNMTSLTFQVSRALLKTFAPGDTLVLTRMDHDANVSPWLLAAQDHGCRVRFVDFDPSTGMLDQEDYQAALEEKPRLVAFGYASNALGTINPVARMIRQAHEAGALVYVDAVQYAPHGPIDVQALDADFLVCSAYKFFGPHMGVLYGRYDLLAELPAYKVRPADDLPPDRWETGTPSFEAIAGALGAVEYFEWLGQKFGSEHLEACAGQYSGRRLTLKLGMQAVRAYELELSRALLDTICSLPGATLYGPSDPRQLDRRVPTFSMRLAGWSPAQLAERLDLDGIYTWDGNFYALEVTRRLGLEEQGGLLRIGAVHYNTLAEIERLREVLQSLNK